MKSQKVYLGFTVVGSREKLELVKTIAMMLEQRGHRILTKHLLSDHVRIEEGMKSPEYVFERDMKWIKECDVFIAEVSGSSFGIGFESGFLLGESKKKVYLLYDAALKNDISKMATGNSLKKCTVLGYNSISEVREFIEKHF